MTAESLGRFVGPACFSNMYAWSISPSVRDWVGCRFVFVLSSAIMALVSALAWRTFTNLVEQAKPKPAQPRRAKVGRGGGLFGAFAAPVVADDDGAASAAASPDSSSSSSNPVVKQAVVGSPHQQQHEQRHEQQRQRGSGTLEAII